MRPRPEMSSTGAYTAAGRTFEIREWREGEDYRAAAFEDGIKVTAPATLTAGEAENLEMQGHSDPTAVLRRTVVNAIAGLTGVKASQVRPLPGTPASADESGAPGLRSGAG